MAEQILDVIFDGRLNLSEYEDIENEDCIRIYKEMQSIKTELMNEMDDNLNQRFEEYCDKFERYYMLLLSEEVKEAYKLGFSISRKIGMECDSLLEKYVCSL